MYIELRFLAPLMHSMQKPTSHVNVKSNCKDVFLFGMGIFIGAGLTFICCTFLQKPLVDARSEGLIKAQQDHIKKQDHDITVLQHKFMILQHINLMERTQAQTRRRKRAGTSKPNNSIVRTAITPKNDALIDKFFLEKYKVGATQ